jgi:hypothetical protein
VREEWPVVPNKVWDQIGTTMERLGKQHIGFHLCVSQSIARGLNSLGSSISKQAQELEAEVSFSRRDLLNCVLCDFLLYACLLCSCMLCNCELCMMLRILRCAV